MASIDVMMAQGESCDPLTPVERTILDLLLKKQARAGAATKTTVQAESKATCSAVNLENPADGPKPAPENKPIGSPKKTRFSARLQQKANETACDQDIADGNMEDLDDFSEGPLNDEQLDKLMREFNFGSADDESQESENPTYEPPTRAGGRGRGRGRGRGGAGRGSKTTRGARSSARTPRPSLEDSEDVDSDCLLNGNESEEDQNDPTAAGYAYLQKMSDAQVVQHMTTYQEEKKISAGGNIDSNDFAAWLSRKLSSMAVTKPVPSSSRGRRSGVVVFEEKGPTRGSRGRGRGAPKGRRGTRQSMDEGFEDDY